MNNPLRSSVILFLVLLVLQHAVVLMSMDEKYESRAVIQIQPPTPAEQYNVCNVETIRGFLEHWDLDADVRRSFGLEAESGPSQKPLVPRRFQEADPVSNTFAFRFRHSSPETAQKVVAAFLEGIENRWRVESETRLRNVLSEELNSLERNLPMLQNQIREMAPSRTMLASSANAWVPGMIPEISISYPNPEFEQLVTERNRAVRRLEEIRILLARPALKTDIPARWAVLAGPTVAQRPLWPSRKEMSGLALINSLVWAVAFFAWRRFSN